MSSRPTVPTYPRQAIVMHWVAAVLIIIEWPLGKFGVNDDGSTTDFVNGAHIWIGIAVFVLTLFRIVQNFTGPRVEELPMPRWEDILFKINHVVLYLSLLAASLTGIGMLISAGELPPFTGSGSMEALEDSRAGELHESPTTILMLMFVMHVLGVAYYQIKHGRTLRRMGVPAPN